jgi:hypothetical protein
MDTAGIRFTFLAATGVARTVIAGEAVATAWEKPSALRKFSVGGLAGHLARTVLTVVDYLSEPPAGPPTVDAAAYFVNALPTDDIDSELNAAIRRRGDELAAAGQASLLVRLDEAYAWLTEQLPLEPAGRTMTVIGKQVILLDEYLRTRLVELALHIDDMCVSVEVDTPTVPGMDIAIGTLVDVARFRHGDVAVLRALGRRERDPGQVLRVF